MDAWKLYAFAAAVFAGATAVLAKAGLKQVNADIALALRTAMVLALIVVNVIAWQGATAGAAAVKAVSAKTMAVLAASAFTTALSWVCYFRALKGGSVSFVALADKSSVLVTLFLSALLLGEPLTLRLLGGAALMVLGLLVLVSGK